MFGLGDLVSVLWLRREVGPANDDVEPAQATEKTAPTNGAAWNKPRWRSRILSSVWLDLAMLSGGRVGSALSVWHHRSQHSLDQYSPW